MKARYKAIILVLSTIMIFSAIGSIAGTGTGKGAAGKLMPSDVEREDWFDSRWHYRLYLQVNAGAYMRQDYPIDMLVDFSSYIEANDTIDSNSIRVLDNGTEIPSQYDVVNDTAGNLIFVVNGSTGIGETRNYTVYFDPERNGLKPVPDYGEPSYVTDYEQLAEEGKFLGSSPLNGSSDTWFFPSYLNHSNYEYQERVVGDVKATWNAWGDAWNGTDWIRQHARAIAYRDSFNVYLTVWSNASDDEVAWASGLVNISTGRPWFSTENPDRKDWGLHVLTDNWDVPNVSAIDYGCYPLMASGSVDTYNHLINKSCIVTFEPGDTSDAVLMPQSDSIVSIETVMNVTSGNNTVLDQTDYVLVDNYAIDMDGIDFFFTAVAGESFEVNYTVKQYDWSDTLHVNAKNGTMEYLITYDADNETNDLYQNPDISAIIFPDQIAASNMVVEFWENRTLRAPGDPFFDYYLNISTNYHEWWYNTSLTPTENHDPQENEFDMIFSYLNGSADPEQDVVDFIASTRNPANVTILLQEDAIPVSLSLNDPKNGQSYNGWTGLIGVPLSDGVNINATIGGETVGRIYYKFGKNGDEVDFNGTALVPLANVSGDTLDGRIELYVSVVDTNGTDVTVHVTIFIVKTWYQSFFSAFGTTFIVISALLASFLTMCGMATVMKRRENKVVSSATRS